MQCIDVRCVCVCAQGATLIQSPRPQRTRSAAYLEEAGASGVDTAAAAAAAAAHAAAGPTVHAQPWREVQARGMGPVNGEVQPRAPLDSDRSNSTVERREKLERLYDSVKLEDRRARTNDGAIDTRLQRAQTVRGHDVTRALPSKTLDSLPCSLTHTPCSVGRATRAVLRQLTASWSILGWAAPPGYVRLTLGPRARAQTTHRRPSRTRGTALR